LLRLRQISPLWIAPFLRGSRLLVTATVSRVRYAEGGDARAMKQDDEEER
jgi:hypothetical protein